MRRTSVHRVPAELLGHSVGQHQSDHRLGDHPGRGHRGRVAALVDRLGRLAGLHVDGVEGARHRGDGLHRGADPEHLAVAHAALDAARAVGPPAHAIRARLDLVMGLRAAAACGGEAVADLDALHGLDAHDGGGQPGVEPPVPVREAAQAGRQVIGQDLDHPAEGVAVRAGRVDLLHHRGARLRVGAAHGVRVDARRVVRAGQQVIRRG